MRLIPDALYNKYIFSYYKNIYEDYFSSSFQNKKDYLPKYFDM